MAIIFFTLSAPIMNGDARAFLGKAPVTRIVLPVRLEFMILSCLQKAFWPRMNADKHG